MMYFFFGDSHSRQFVGVSWGVFCHYIFSGATIQGLGNSQSLTGHARIIEHALSYYAKKTALFMFGNVDLDFSMTREIVLQGQAFDRLAFVQSRITRYLNFVKSLIHSRDSNNLERIIILCPQISPLRQEHFFATTAIQTGLTERDIRTAAATNDLTDHARASAICHFNDEMERAFVGTTHTTILRIDKLMVDNNGAVLDRFVSGDRRDHHADTSETRNLWNSLLGSILIDHLIVG